MEIAEIRKDPTNRGYVIFIRQEKIKIPEGACPFDEGNESMTPPEILAYRGYWAPNQPGWKIRVVPNLNPIFQVVPLTRDGIGEVYDRIRGAGANEIIIESPNHRADWRNMTKQQISEILAVYKARVSDLKRWKDIRSILIYRHFRRENGKMEHPYSTLVAAPVTFPALREKLDNAKRYYQNLKERCLFCDIIRLEMKREERIITETPNFIAIVPYTARTPFETCIYPKPKNHGPFFEESDLANSIELAGLLKEILAKLEKVVEDDGWTMVIFSQNTNDFRRDYWQTIREDFHWHVEIVPAKDFQRVTGFYINPVFPEEAAKILREA
jgi:UDPglucose--hexose-1-phosphate uridylyltransferase